MGIIVFVFAIFFGIPALFGWESYKDYKRKKNFEIYKQKENERTMNLYNNLSEQQKQNITLQELDGIIYMRGKILS